MKQISWMLTGLMVVVELLVTGCYAEPPVTKGIPTSSQTTRRILIVDSARLQATKDSLAVLASAPDTFYTSNRQVFRMRPVSKAQYMMAGGPSQVRNFPADSATAVATEKEFLKSEAGRVWRAADTLVFRLNTGRFVRLRNRPTYQDAEDSYEGYRYLDNLAIIQQWLVEVGQWEGRYFLLVDQQTGKQTKLISYPTISPDHKRFVCANFDPIGYSTDGLQLWQKPAGRPPQLRWQSICPALSPRWKDNHTLFFYEDFTIAGRYVQIEL